MTENSNFIHGNRLQIKRVIDETNSKKLIPIHTQHEEYHRKWHKNVTTINQHVIVNV